MWLNSLNFFLKHACIFCKIPWIWNIIQSKHKILHLYEAPRKPNIRSEFSETLLIGSFRSPPWMDSKDPLADLLPFLSAPHLHSSWLSWKCKIQIQIFPGWPSDFSVWFPSPYFLIVLTCPSLTNWSFSTQEKTSMQSSLLKMHIDHHIAQILNMRKHFVQMIVYETDSRLSDKKKEIRKNTEEIQFENEGTKKISVLSWCHQTANSGILWFSTLSTLLTNKTAYQWWLSP